MYALRSTLLVWPRIISLFLFLFLQAKMRSLSVLLLFSFKSPPLVDQFHRQVGMVVFRARQSYGIYTPPTLANAALWYNISNSSEAAKSCQSSRTTGIGGNTSLASTFAAHHGGKSQANASGGVRRPDSHTPTTMQTYLRFNNHPTNVPRRSNPVCAGIDQDSKGVHSPLSIKPHQPPSLCLCLSPVDDERE